MTSMTNEEAFAELYYAKKAIYDVLGITVQCWRVSLTLTFRKFELAENFLTCFLLTFVFFSLHMEMSMIEFDGLLKS